MKHESSRPHGHFRVSEICLGTMTWGSAEQRERMPIAQMDYALDQGVNFFDNRRTLPDDAAVARNARAMTERLYR